MKPNPTIIDCIEILDGKGLIQQLHWLLLKHGFQIYIRTSDNAMNNFHEKFNNQAIYDTYIEAHYLI